MAALCFFSEKLENGDCSKTSYQLQNKAKISCKSYQTIFLQLSHLISGKTLQKKSSAGGKWKVRQSSSNL